MRYIKFTIYQERHSQESLDAYLSKPEEILVNPSMIVYLQPFSTSSNPDIFKTAPYACRMFLGGVDYGDRYFIVNGSIEEIADRIYQC